MTRYFLGVDFANVEAANAKCCLRDEAGEITLCSALDTVERDAEVDGAALDAPFGLTKPTVDLLQGRYFDGDPEELRLRETDRKVGAVISQMRIADPQRTNLRGHRLFNRGSHIHPPMAFQTLPNAIREVLRLEGRDTQNPQVSSPLTRSRLGQGRVVEAHPRLFLYSLLGRLNGRYKTTEVETELLEAARDYGPAKRRMGEANREFEERQQQRRYNRERLIREICEGSSLWAGSARLQFSGDFSSVAATDHSFDAFLCSLTALMHSKGETLLWSELRVDKSTVEVEGHMHILRTTLAS